MPELTEDQHNAIMQMRRDAYAAFATRWPDRAGSLYVAAMAGAAIDILATASPGGAKLYQDIFNSHAVMAGLPHRIVARAN
jgi:hypothetical protein